MTHALTEDIWLRTLDRIATSQGVTDTTKTLAYMLREIIYACNDRDDLADILDTYGSRLLERP